MLDPMEPATDLCVSLFANRQSVRSLFLAPNGSLLLLVKFTPRPKTNGNEHGGNIFQVVKKFVWGQSEYIK